MKSKFSIPPEQIENTIKEMVASRFTTANNLTAQAEMDKKNVQALRISLEKKAGTIVNNDS